MRSPFRLVRRGGSGLAAVVCLTADAHARPIDPAASCAILGEATVTVRGDLVRYDGAAEIKVPDFRSGSGFYVGDDVVVTAHHVISRLDDARVCDATGACRDVIEVVGWPDADIAILRLAPGAAGHVLAIGTSAGAGQAIFAAGYPGDLGFVCGPGHVVGATALREQPYLLFDGTVAGPGSSGGPVVTVGNRRKIIAVGVVSGASSVGEVRFNRAAAVGTLDLGATGGTLGDWRRDQPWAEIRDVAVKLPPGRAWWEDLTVPPLQDIAIDGPADGLCYGLYRAPRAIDARLGDPDPIAWTCDGQALTYTTSAEEIVRIGLWSDRAAGFDGHVAFRRR